MSVEVVSQISKEEINWVKSKVEGIHKTARRMLKDAIEIGQWFLDAEERSGQKENRTWGLWLRATFPEMHKSTIANYMRLARGKNFLEQEELTNVRQFPLGVRSALNLLTAQGRKEKQSQKALQLAPAEFEEPLQILHDQLRNYVHQRFQLQYLEDQIKFRIKNAKLGRRQIRQAIEWVTREHLEIRELVLKAFLG